MKLKLKRREKILLMISGGLVVLVGLYFLLIAGDPRTEDQLIADQNKYNTEIAKKEKDIQTGKRDQKRLDEWQRKALPAEPLVARALYDRWLRDLAQNTKLQQFTLTAQEVGATTRQSQYTRVPFKLTARANLASLVDFMYRFYSAGYLHQIRTLNIKPDRTSSAKPDTNLVLTLSIEALSLPAAEAKNSLPKEPSHALQLAKLVDYQPIVTRNFFGPYVRPPLPPDPPTGSRDKPPIRELAVVDAAQFAVVTAITQVDDEPQVWIQDRMGGVLWKLAAGESFAVGTARWKEQGTVQSINSEEVVVDFRNARRLLHNGDSIVSGPMQAVPAMTPTAISVPDRGPASGNASPPSVVAGDPTQPANAFGRGGRGGRGGGRGGSSRNNRQAPVGDVPQASEPSTGAQAAPPAAAATDQPPAGRGFGGGRGANGRGGRGRGGDAPAFGRGPAPVANVPEASDEGPAGKAAPPAAQVQVQAPKPPAASVEPVPMALPPAVLLYDPDEAEGEGLEDQ